MSAPAPPQQASGLAAPLWRESVGRFGPLFRNLVRRDVRQRYKGSFLGLAWSLVQPAIMVTAYYVVFRFIWKVTIPNYWLLLFVGLTVWTFFFGGIVSGSQSLVANANLVTKVRFPRAIVPLSAITGNAVIAGAMLLVALPLCLWLMEGTRLALLALPLIVVMLAMFTVGLGLALSAVNVYFRDVEHILTAVGLPWIFLSPVFWTPANFDQIAPGLKDNDLLLNLFYYGNPPAPFIVSIQKAMFFGTWPSGIDLAYCLVVGVVALTIGVLVFRRLEREIAVEL